MGLIYLATPYNDPDPAVRQRRFESVTCTAADLMIDEGVPVFSPISHTHLAAKAPELDFRWGFWSEFYRHMLKACDRFIVLRQEGWEASVGVTAEIKIAKELGLPIEYMDPLYSF